MNEYVGTRRITFEDSGATFVVACVVCGRFVKADESVFVNDRSKPNADCAKCGRTQMIFEGYM